MAPPDVPPLFGDIAGVIIGMITVLLVLAALFGAITVLRRSARYCIGSWRNEGWGLRGKKGDELGDDPGTPTLEMAKALLTAAKPPAPTDASVPGAGGEEKPAA